MGFMDTVLGPGGKVPGIVDTTSWDSLFGLVCTVLGACWIAAGAGIDCRAVSD